MIELASRDNDIAVRDEAMLRDKIATGRAVVGLDGGELVGFGYFAEWEGGRRVSHSGLVVAESHQGIGLGRRLKEALIAASDALFPDASTISLTTSKAVEALNLSLGFRRCELDELTDDPAFWEGCLTCRNYARVQARGEKCCCFGMIREPSSKDDEAR